jgi:hypothetical protein
MSVRSVNDDEPARRTSSLPLEYCANGCGVPPAPPSLVICAACRKKIGDRLRRWAGQGFVDQDPEVLT